MDCLNLISNICYVHIVISFSTVFSSLYTLCLLIRFIKVSVVVIIAHRDCWISEDTGLLLVL
jgi:hypothetical protein